MKSRRIGLRGLRALLGAIFPQLLQPAGVLEAESPDKASLVYKQPTLTLPVVVVDPAHNDVLLAGSQFGASAEGVR